MMARQRQKIYSIEADFPVGGYTTIEGMQLWLDWVTRTKWWHDHTTNRHVRAKYSTAMSGANKVDDLNADIGFFVFSLCQLTACHELAHVIGWLPGKDHERDHGPKFAGIYLALVKRYIGVRTAASLEKVFVEKGVKFTPYE